MPRFFQNQELNSETITIAIIFIIAIFVIKIVLDKVKEHKDKKKPYGYNYNFSQTQESQQELEQETQVIYKVTKELDLDKVLDEELKNKLLKSENKEHIIIEKEALNVEIIDNKPYIRDKNNNLVPVEESELDSDIKEIVNKVMSMKK